MEKYEQQIELFFELKNSPDSTRESMRRRISDFLLYIEMLEIAMEEITFEDIQGYILHLKRDRLETTNAYLHMTSKSLMGVKSPIDNRGDHPS